MVKELLDKLKKVTNMSVSLCMEWIKEWVSSIALKTKPNAKVNGKKERELNGLVNLKNVSLIKMKILIYLLH